MEDIPELQESQEFVPLPKHVYPLWVRGFGLFTLVAFMGTLVNFVYNDLPVHREVRGQIIAANSAFYRGDYSGAIDLYGQLINTYPTFKEGKMNMAKSYFALSADSFDGLHYFYAGINVLAGERYSVAEQRELKRYLSVHFCRIFDSQLTTA